MSTIRKLSSILENKIKEEFNEDQNTTEEYLKYIKEWLAKQPHLNVPDNDQWLVAFLRGCKYRLELVKTKLDNYYSFRTFYTDDILNRDITISPLSDLIAAGVILPFMSKTTETTPVYVFLRYNFDPSKCSYNDLMKLYYITYDILLLEYDQMTINGVTFIIDVSHATLAHFGLVNTSRVKQSNQILLGAYPLRSKATHFINASPGFIALYEIFKKFQPAKLVKRHFFHSKLEDLYNHIPVDDLPKELGGTNGSIDEFHEFWKAKFLERKEYLINDEQYRSNEKLRVGSPKFDSEMFGVDGSFRKLNVD